MVPAAFSDVAAHELLSHSNKRLLRMNLFSYGAWRATSQIFSVNSKHIISLVEARVV